MDHALASFGGFSDLLGLSKVRDYLVSRRVHEIEEWGLYQLDEEGQSLQKELDERLKVRKSVIPDQRCAYPSSGSSVTNNQIIPELLNRKGRKGHTNIQGFASSVARGFASHPSKLA